VTRDRQSPVYSLDDPADAPVHALSDAFGSGQLTSARLVDRCLERIASLDGDLHAFVSTYADDARRAARAADDATASGHRIGPFHGIPVAVKDIVEIEGRITTGGSKAWIDRRSTVTATLVRRLVGAGMIVLGKTHSVEFAMGSFGTNTYMGSPRNPWDRVAHRAPGGSSSGTAVAVAAGLAPCGIGTDTGGSVRVPAAWCGIVGLKTTLGRISVHGVLPLAQSLDTPGPMCRDVEDAALLYELLRGPDPLDPLTLVPPLDAPLDGLRRGVAGLTMARLPAAEREAVDAEVLHAYDAALALLERQGARLMDVRLPSTFAGLGQLVGRLIGCEGYAHVGHLVDDDSAPVDPHVRPRIQLGKGVSARDYLHLLRDVEQLRRDWNAALAGCDALLTPTTLSPAPRVADIDQSGTAAVFTRAINLVKGCALTVPDGFTTAGLPIGLQIACGTCQEALALRIGWAYEQDTEWHRRRPALG
jgi:aspartyl-tRNA(Asn)/glutamyl-tRNA(Gln) amidotransferase subunit A